jgi:hypothetical protein
MSNFLRIVYSIAISALIQILYFLVEGFNQVRQGYMLSCNFIDSSGPCSLYDYILNNILNINLIFLLPTIVLSVIIFLVLRSAISSK